MTKMTNVEPVDGPVPPDVSALADQLVAAVKSQVVELTGPSGLLTGLAKQVLEPRWVPNWMSTSVTSAVSGPGRATHKRERTALVDAGQPQPVAVLSRQCFDGVAGC